MVAELMMVLQLILVAGVMQAARLQKWWKKKVRKKRADCPPVDGEVKKCTSGPTMQGCERSSDPDPDPQPCASLPTTEELVLPRGPAKGSGGQQFLLPLRKHKVIIISPSGEHQDPSHPLLLMPPSTPEEFPVLSLAGSRSSSIESLSSSLEDRPFFLTPMKCDQVPKPYKGPVRESRLALHEDSPQKIPVEIKNKCVPEVGGDRTESPVDVELPPHTSSHMAYMDNTVDGCKDKEMHIGSERSHARKSGRSTRSALFTSTLTGYLRKVRAWSRRSLKCCWTCCLQLCCAPIPDDP